MNDESRFQNEVDRLFNNVMLGRDDATREELCNLVHQQRRCIFRLQQELRESRAEYDSSYREWSARINKQTENERLRVLDDEPEGE